MPNIKAVQSLSIFEVADELARLAANAKGLVTVPSDLQGTCVRSVLYSG